MVRKIKLGKRGWKMFCEKGVLSIQHQRMLEELSRQKAAAYENKEKDGPLVDENKGKVSMVLGMPMYNELVKGHLIETMDNALAVGFDNIVVFDDGSTDGSWDVLQQYAKKHNHIKIFRDEKNSVLSRGKNRWRRVVDEMAKFEPDWIVLRAADQVYSHKATIVGGDLFRKRLTDFYHGCVELVCLPLAHLWRSRSWYRFDGVWGKDIKTHSKTAIWRYHKDYNYEGRETTGAHLGWHIPTSFGFGGGREKVVQKINCDDDVPWPIVVLHLGHVTHENKLEKFKWSMEAAKKAEKSILMPPPDEMPPVSEWMKYNGYKGFYEFENIVLERAPEVWFKEGFEYEPNPLPPESLYPIIFMYNKERAREYKKLYEDVWGVKFSSVWPPDKSFPPEGWVSLGGKNGEKI